MPVTFSLCLNEKEFKGDLQEFACYFLATKEGLPLKTGIAELKQNLHGNAFTFNFRMACQDIPNFAMRRYQSIDICKMPIDPVFHTGKGLWILKPSGLNRGKGLELFKTLEELNHFLRLYSSGYEVKEFINMNYSDKDNSSPIFAKCKSMQKTHEPLVLNNSSSNTLTSSLPPVQEQGFSKSFEDKVQTTRHAKSTFNSFVIQKYLERPFLFRNHKFDIRAFGLLTHTMQLFVFA